MSKPSISAISIIILISLFIASCTGPLVEVTVIDQRTALENQVLGTYKELSDDVLLLASVRSIDESGKLKPAPRIPDGKRRVLAAMQRRDFNKDDIELFKSIGAAGENNKGLLNFFPTQETTKSKEYEQFVKSIINEESEDRLIIMQRIVDTNENFSEGDLPEVQKIFASLNMDNAKKEERIQLDDGRWIRKE